jgi:hypothetical protein
VKQDKNDIRDLLSAKLRPVRKGPAAPRLRLVGSEVDAKPAPRDEAMSPEQKEIAAANAIAVDSAMHDLDFASRVGSLTRMDVLCANQGRPKSPGRKKLR